MIVLQKKAENTNGILMTVTCVIMSCAVLRALHEPTQSLDQSYNAVTFHILQDVLIILFIQKYFSMKNSTTYTFICVCILGRDMP